MGASQVLSDAALRRLDAEPIDADKIRFSPRVVAAFVGACLSIFGGMYASTYGLRSDVRDILTTMENQKRVEELNQKISDTRATALEKSIDTIDKRQQLQALEIQGLKEMVLKQGVK